MPPKLYPVKESDDIAPDWVDILLEGCYQALGQLRSAIAKAQEARRQQLQIIRLDEDTST